MVNAFGGTRDVIIKFDASPVAFSIDAYEAVIEKVKQLEGKRAAGVGEADMSAKKVVLFGKTPYKVHVFDLTLVDSTATYTFEFTETVPTIEDIS